MVAFDLAGQQVHRVAHVRRGTHGTQGVVLAHLGDAEDADHRITDVLLDGPSVGHEARAGGLEVATQDARENLGVETLP